MTTLTIHAETDGARPLEQSRDPAVIAARLAEIGVAYERWRAGKALAAEADDAAVLAAYADDIARLKTEGGYRSVDVIRLNPDHPDCTALRAKFLAEHTHADDEVRFFVEGAARFYLHKAGKVFLFDAEAGDLIRVPAQTAHWFDMGPSPRFTALRLFVSPDGWEAHFTGSPIAERFAKFEATVT
jgi:1,2-dihydroxy-3-keto-5-methylthiopentene dioxygenase